MLTSTDINEIAAALAKAQAEMGDAVKNAKNPFFRSDYADLASVRAATKGPLTKHGIAVVQFPQTAYLGQPESYEWTSKTGEKRFGVRVTCVVSVVTRLVHTSGQWMEDAVSAMLATGDPQAVGSAISYLRRYALQSVCGIAAEDDDAEAAQPVPVPPNWDRVMAGAEPPPWVTEPDTGLAAAAARTAKRVEARDETRGVFVESIVERPTKNPAIVKYWVKFSDGNEASTIREKLVTVAKIARDTRAPMTVKTEHGKYGLEILDLVLLPAD